MATKINVRTILEGYFRGLSKREIERTRHVSFHSVHNVLLIAKQKGISSIDDISEKSDEDLYKEFFPDKLSSSELLSIVDYSYVHKELNKTGVTLKLLWEEYCSECIAKGTIPVSYVTYTRGYSSYIGAKGFANHIEHKAGDRIEVDWSGPTMHYLDLKAGKRVTVYLFVADCVSSRLVYVEPTLNMNEMTWIQCHINMWNYYGGVSRLLICDNLKTGVIKHPKEGEIVLTKEYELLMEHYGTGIIPTGVKKPREKNSTENSVYNVALSIIAKLRNVEFTSFSALKIAVKKELESLNNEPFEKRIGSRRSDFEDNERSALRPLPKMPFEVGQWYFGRKVQPNCHIVFEKNWYSCPCRFQGKTVDVKATPSEIQIYSDGRLIKRHIRFMTGVEYRYRTDKIDMPKGSGFQEWDVTRINSWADSIGPNTKTVIQQILKSKEIPEQAFNAAIAVLGLTKTVGKEKLEMASEAALAKVTAPRYHHIKSILSQINKNLDSKKSDVKTDLGMLKGQEYFENFGANK